MKRRVKAIVQLVTCGGLLLVTATSTLAQTQEERALTAVREQLEALQGRLVRSNADRDRQYGELRRIELDGAAAAAALGNLGEDAKRARSVLESMQKDPHPRVRAAVRDALDAIPAK